MGHAAMLRDVTSECVAEEVIEIPANARREAGVFADDALVVRVEMIDATGTKIVARPARGAL